MMTRARIVGKLCLAALMLPGAAVASPRLTLLYQQLGPSDDPLFTAFAAGPSSGVIYAVDAQGGGCQSCGSVLQITSPAQRGQLWTAQTLYAASSTIPDAVLIAGPGGVLYGLELVTLSSSYLYRLSPPGVAGGAWTHDVLATLPGAGESLVMDAEGNFYSGQSNTIYEISPPTTGSGPWSVQALYKLRGAEQLKDIALSPDETALFGVTGNQDTIFRLDRHSLAFSEVYKLPKPDKVDSNLLVDAGGTVTATEDGPGGGSIFQLAPPGAGQSTWSLQTLVSLRPVTTPQGTIVRNSAGAIFGQVCCSPFATYELDPPAVGGGWTYTMLNALKPRSYQSPGFGVSFDHVGNLVFEDWETPSGGVPHEQIWRETPLHPAAP